MLKLISPKNPAYLLFSVIILGYSCGDKTKTHKAQFATEYDSDSPAQSNIDDSPASAKPDDNNSEPRSTQTTTITDNDNENNPPSSTTTFSELSQKLYADLAAINDKNKKYLADNNLTKTTLTFMVFNLGLLNIIDEFIQVPAYEERSANLESAFIKEFSQNNAPDIIFLQELWHKKDFETILSIAARLNYDTAVPEFQNTYYSDHGLQILVKKSLLTEPNSLSHNSQFHKFIEQSSLERILTIDRGILSSIITLKNGRQILLATTHLTPMMVLASHRSDQLDELAAYLTAKSNDADFIVLGADINSAADFSETSLIKNIVMTYDQSLYYSFYENTRALNFLDTYRTVHTDEGFTYNTQLNSIAASTVSDTTRISQRIDYIWVGSLRFPNNFYVEGSQLLFTQSLTSDNGTNLSWQNGSLYLSDHFAVQSVVVIE